MVHISGLGMAGSYLLRRMSQDGFNVSAYDPKRDNYYLPCGYATNEKLLSAYLEKLNMDVDDYVQTRSENVSFAGNNFGEISFDAKGICTIDKKRLENDMVSGIESAYLQTPENPDIRVDATGISRAVLGRSDNDYTMYAKEYLTDKSTHKDFHFYFFEKGHGYFWEFPLGGKYHVGAGSDDMNLIESRLESYPRETVTGRKIRLTPLFDEIAKGNAIGIGEAIGTVSPISGEGIIPSVKSAELLFQAMRKYSDLEKIKDAYIFSIRKEFGYYTRLRSIVKKIQNGERLGLADLRAAGSAKKDLENFGIDFRISKVIRHFI